MDLVLKIVSVYLDYPLIRLLQVSVSQTFFCWRTPFGFEK
jgi:hypothetical protein